MRTHARAAWLRFGASHQASAECEVDGQGNRCWRQPDNAPDAVSPCLTASSNVPSLCDQRFPDLAFKEFRSGTRAPRSDTLARLSSNKGGISLPGSITSSSTTKVGGSPIGPTILALKPPYGSGTGSRSYNLADDGTTETAVNHMRADCAGAAWSAAAHSLQLRVSRLASRHDRACERGRRA